MGTTVTELLVGAKDLVEEDLGVETDRGVERRTIGGELLLIDVIAEIELMIRFRRGEDVGEDDPEVVGDDERDEEGVDGGVKGGVEEGEPLEELLSISPETAGFTKGVRGDGRPVSVAGKLIGAFPWGTLLVESIVALKANAGENPGK
jgi:hypothetical protein